MHRKSEEMNEGDDRVSVLRLERKNVARDNVKLRLVKLYAQMLVLCFNYVHDQREELILRSIKRGRIDK